MVFYIKQSLINIEIDNNKKIIIDNKEHRGGSNKFFTKEDEKKLFNYFKNNFIDKNELLCDEIIKIKTICESSIIGAINRLQ